MEVIKGYGAPTAETIGDLNDLYVDLDTGDVYRCTNVTTIGEKWGDVTLYACTLDNTVYTWAAAGVVSDATTVTAESITEALGYTPADDAEVTQLKSDFTELEIEVADVKGALNKLRCSEIGMMPNDDNGNNFTLLCEAISKADTIIVDGFYILAPTATYTIDKNISIIGDGKNCGFEVTNVGGGMYYLGDKCYRFELDDLLFTSVSEISNVLFTKNDYLTSRMNFVKINGCQFEGNISPVRFNQNVEIDPENIDIGVDTISITNNTFLNNKRATCFVFADVSYNVLEVYGNTIRNMGNCFLISGTTNESPYVNQIAKSKKFTHIHHNDVYNDDACFISEYANGTYYVFALIEGDRVHYHHNRVEGLKSNSYVALYDAYLSCADVIYEYNYWKNNCVFDETCPSNVLMKSKGNAGIVDVGVRKYHNNIFITEKSFYEKFNALGNGYVRMVDSVSLNTFDVQDNQFDLYRAKGFLSSSDVVGFIFRNNDLKVYEWLDSCLCAGVNGSEIICDGNTVTINTTDKFSGVYTGSYVAKRIVFTNNVLKNCRYVLGSGRAEELIFTDNTITDDIDHNSQITSEGIYSKIIGRGNKYIKQNGKFNLFNGLFRDSIDYVIHSVTTVRNSDLNVILLRNDIFTMNKKAINVEFEGHVVGGSGNDYFKAIVSLGFYDGKVKYNGESGMVAEELAPEIQVSKAVKPHMLSGKKLPFDVALSLSGAQDRVSRLYISTPSESKIEMTTRISSVDIDYINTPTVYELPSDYKQVEYIESDGNQYINTGVIASDYASGIHYVFSGSPTAFSGSGNEYLFGSSYSSASRCCNAYINATSGTPSRRFGVMAGANANRIACTEDYPIIGEDFILDITCCSNDLDNAVVKLNDVALSGESGFANCEMSNTPIYLFTCYGYVNSYNFTGRLYSFMMYDISENPIRNFVPCYRVVDNVVGLYDTVNSVFYENEGTGVFKIPSDTSSYELDISSVVESVLKALPTWEGGSY